MINEPNLSIATDLSKSKSSFSLHLHLSLNYWLSLPFQFFQGEKFPHHFLNTLKQPCKQLICLYSIELQFSEMTTLLVLLYQALRISIQQFCISYNEIIFPSFSFLSKLVKLCNLQSMVWMLANINNICYFAAFSNEILLYSLP